MDEAEAKHRCKVCGQSFINIRALCGHKQVHSFVKKTAKKGVKKDEIELGFQENHQKSSEFGENPKEKGGHSTFCEKCDRGFKSFRALHGHMRLHSKKNVARRRLLGKDLRLPNNPPKEKRSVRRYKFNTCSINYSFWSSWKNSSGSTSSVSVIDEEELKEVASCLLMLAKGGFYSADDYYVSADSEMMRFDVEPSCNDTDVDNNTVMKRVTVNDSVTNFDVSKSGHVSVEEIAGFLGFESDVCKIRQEFVECDPTVNLQYQSELCDIEVRDELTEVALAKSIFGGVSDSEAWGPALVESKSGLNGVASQVSDKLNLSTSGSTVASNSRLKYICDICDKGFRSGQALGGHRLHCPRSKRFCTSETAASVRTDVQSEAFASQKTESESVKSGVDHKKKRVKPSTCLVCCKTFASGQALGGHMRAHFQGNSQSSVKQKEAFDLNIPAAAEDETSFHHVPNPHTLPALVPVS